MNTAQLGQDLRARRRRLGLDQRALAEIAQVSVHSLSDIESGKGNPTLGTVERLCLALGLDLVLRPRVAGDGAAP